MFELLKIIGYAKEAYNIQQEIYEQLKNKFSDGISGGGMVKVKINGHFEVKFIEIDDSLFIIKDKLFLQDMILSAINDGIKNAKIMISEEMKALVSKMAL